MRRITASWLCLASCLTSPLLAFDLDPWIPPPGELNCSTQYLYTWQDVFQSPAGSFIQAGSVHQFQTCLQLTPLPRVDTQLEIDFGADSSINFSYAATCFLSRYQLLDETEGALISFVPGIAVIFAQDNFINDNNFYYIGPTNFLFSASLGKSFYCRNEEEWITRIWLYQAYGFATQGQPWVVGVWNFEWKIAPNLTWAWFTPFSFGTGHDNILQDAPFFGYGSIDYQFVDLYMSFNYDLPRDTSFSLWAYHNLYARNSSQGYYGGGVSLKFPLGQCKKSN
ncbi:MAG: hypothetical protein JSS62_04545 [Verrucomicrobia bacterium]|nr:hypothetical protein [Verrucomicrobiota bacterium]